MIRIEPIERASVVIDRYRQINTHTGTGQYGGTMDLSYPYSSRLKSNYISDSRPSTPSRNSDSKSAQDGKFSCAGNAGNFEEAPTDEKPQDLSSKQHKQSTETTRSTLSRELKSLSPPPLSFNPWSKKWSIIFCTAGLLLFDLVLPCIIYYILSDLTSLNDFTVLGLACASLGLGELLELPWRGYRLVKYRDEYAPLGQDKKWGFDFLFWWYLIATIIGIVPYVFSTSIGDEPIYWLFLFTPGFLVGFAVFTTSLSAIAFRLPCRVSSDAKGERCKPFVYYVVEDFVAVDAGQKRGYRLEFKKRYDESPVFRRMIWDVNMWWTIGGVIFIGALAGMTWGLAFAVAYGLSFGLLWVWIGLWALGTLGLVQRALKMERKWFEKRAATEARENKELDIV